MNKMLYRNYGTTMNRLIYDLLLSRPIKQTVDICNLEEFVVLLDYLAAIRSDQYERYSIELHSDLNVTMDLK